MADWRAFCREAKDMRIREGWVEVIKKDDGRKHRVFVKECDDSYELSGIAARKVPVAMPHPDLRLWQRNRATRLVGFRVDSKGQIVGETSVPKAGLHREEFLVYLRQVAAECDQLEYLLTGKDQD